LASKRAGAGRNVPDRRIPESRLRPPSRPANPSCVWKVWRSSGDRDNIATPPARAVFSSPTACQSPGLRLALPDQSTKQFAMVLLVTPCRGRQGAITILSDGGQPLLPSDGKMDLRGRIYAPSATLWHPVGQGSKTRHMGGERLMGTLSADGPELKPVPWKADAGCDGYLRPPPVRPARRHPEPIRCERIILK
jgi:hypothetical protein